jgi:hypothetical protein
VEIGASRGSYPFSALLMVFCRVDAGLRGQGHHVLPTWLCGLQQLINFSSMYGLPYFTQLPGSQPDSMCVRLPLLCTLLLWEAATVSSATCGSPYPTPYGIADAETELNTVLLHWTATGCDGEIIFETGGITFRLTQMYTIWSRISLNASTTGGPDVVIRAATGDRHFIVDGGRLSTDCVVLRDGVTNQYGGSILISGSASGVFRKTSFVNNTARGVNPLAGAVMVLGSSGLRFQECAFLGNAALGTTGPYGGAIALWSMSYSVNITGCVFRGNRASATGPAPTVSEGDSRQPRLCRGIVVVLASREAVHAVTSYVTSVRSEDFLLSTWLALLPTGGLRGSHCGRPVVGNRQDSADPLLGLR